MTNLEMVAAELEAAKKKHPKFVDRFTGYRGYALSVESIEEDLESERERLAIAVNKNRTTFRRVLACEVAEAIAAYAHGDLAHAKQELAQCAAVCIRAMECVDDEINKETNK